MEMLHDLVEENGGQTDDDKLFSDDDKLFSDDDSE